MLGKKKLPRYVGRGSVRGLANSQLMPWHASATLHMTKPPTPKLQKEKEKKSNAWAEDDTSSP